MHVRAIFCRLYFKCQLVFNAFTVLCWSAPLGCYSGANLQPEQLPTHSSVCCVDYAVSCIVHLASAQQFIHSFKESHFPVSFSNSHPVTSWDGVTCCLFAATQCSPATVKSALSQSLQSQARGVLPLLVLVQGRDGRQGSFPQSWPDPPTRGMGVAFIMVFIWSRTGIIKWLLSCMVTIFPFLWPVKAGFFYTEDQIHRRQNKNLRNITAGSFFKSQSAQPGHLLFRVFDGYFMYFNQSLL